MRFYILAALAFTASALPAPPAPPGPPTAGRPGPPGGPVSNPYAYTPELAAFYTALSEEIGQLKNSPGYKSGVFECNMDTAAASFPASIAPALGSPAAGSTLKHVVLGTGFQNYTCPTTANATAAPTAIGAFARLFNVSCIAANYPGILATLPALAYQYQLPAMYFPPPGTIGQSAAVEPEGSFAYQPLNVAYSGTHFFKNLTTPEFNLEVPAPGINNGITLAAKVVSSAAPKTYVLNGSTYNTTQGANGAVAWLGLKAIDGTTNGITNVFRVETQGGSQPATCGPQTGEFNVPYAALYFFYGT